MGLAMARNLLGAGLAVTVWDRSSEAAAGLAREGAQRDSRVQVKQEPDARLRADQTETDLLHDAAPSGPHLGRGRGGRCSRPTSR